MLKIFVGLEDFEPWGQASSIYAAIVNENKLDELECLLEELYPDGINYVALNDILAFDWEWVLEELGIEWENDEDDEG